LASIFGEFLVKNMLKMHVFIPQNHQIAQICTYSFKNFQRVKPPDPIIGKGKPAPRPFPLGACPPSHLFIASVAAEPGNGNSGKTVQFNKN